MKAILIILFSVISANILYGQAVELNAAEIARLKSIITTDEKAGKEFKKLQQLADTSLNKEPSPIEYISTAGRLKGDSIKTATQQAVKEFKIIYALAICYKITGKNTYLQKSLSYLLAWAKYNKPSANPIDDTNLEPLLEGYDLIKDEVGGNDKLIIENWLFETAQAEITSRYMTAGKETATNNWNSHRLKVVGTIALVLQNQGLQDWTLQEFKKQIAANLYSDGSGIDYKLRDAVSYHAYNLSALLRLAIVTDRLSKTNFYTYYAPSGSSIKRSVDWLVPFVSGEKQHSEFVHSAVAFDAKRSANKEKGHIVGEKFKPEDGAEALILASYFDKSLTGLIEKGNIKLTGSLYWLSAIIQAMNNQN